MIEKVRRIIAAADTKIASVNLQVEVAALAHFGKLLIIVTMLCDLTDSEANITPV